MRSIYVFWVFLWGMLLAILYLIWLLIKKLVDVAKTSCINFRRSLKTCSWNKVEFLDFW